LNLGNLGNRPRIIPTSTPFFIFCTLGIPLAFAQEPPADDRIVTPDEVQEAERSPARVPIKIISYPHRAISRGMEKGLIKVEKDHLRERLRLWTEHLRELGITGLFGGLGEQTGFGGGASYTVGRGTQQLTFLARGTFAHYQEFDTRWTASSPKAEFTLAGSYQWRPKENFYGLGHQSQESQHTDFALRQSWVGSRVEFAVPRHIRWGVENKWISNRTFAGKNLLIPSTPDVFPDLPGFGTLLRLYSGGAYVNADFSKGEYEWTGRAQIGASYQHGLGASRLRYFNYEGKLEGRLPVRAGQSAFVGQIALNVNHENSGSDPIPFYMRPHIGGSSTMRGFALDRFYGKNLMLMSLDYRYRLHPNFEASLFHDAGQIFDRAGELAWFNWHRNYGISFRFHNNYRTVLRLEYGFSNEGSMFHLSFGDRAPQPMSGAVRYGTYRR
jgi:hypothetical protein